MENDGIIVESATEGKQEMIQFIFFGDFDQEEYDKYFEGVNIVKFSKINGNPQPGIECKNEQAQGKNHHECAEEAKAVSDIHLQQKSASVSDGTIGNDVESNKNVDNDDCDVSKETLKVSEENHVEEKEDRNSGLSSDGETSNVIKAATAEIKTTVIKPKPTSWAALFKTNSSSAPVNTKAPATMSEHFEENFTKPAVSSTSNAVNDPSRVIPVEKDQNAIALADFLQKSTLNLGSTNLQLRGLINNSNWCYINATLQSLLGCSAFYRLFKSLHPFKQKINKASSTPLTDTMIDFANEFSVLDFKAMNHKSRKADDLKLGTSFEPKPVYEILSVLKSTLSETGKQQDAEEFLTFLLNGLHEEFVSLNGLIQNNTKPKNHPNEIVVNGNISDMTKTHSDDDKHPEKDDTVSADDWEQVGRNNRSSNLRKTSENETLITKLFGGIIRSSVHHAGAKESATLQPFFTIQLDIQAENIWNIKDAFENYFTKENIEGFTSSKTNSKVEASHKTSLEKLPQVLILHLKYFVYDKTGGCQKTHKHVEISKEIEIPRDVLSTNLKGRVPSNQRMYQLFAVEFHHGKHAAGGHYTTAVRHKDPLGWICCNDSIIQKTHFSQITKQQKDKVPYLLFYERMSHFVK